MNLINKTEYLIYKAIFRYWVFILLGFYAISSLDQRLSRAAIAEGVQITSAKSSNTTVTIINFEFQPGNLNVEIGDNVTWINKGARHGVTSDDGSFATVLKSGEAFSFTFNKGGVFPYYCQFHGGPGGRGMSGTITVVPNGENK